MSPACMHQLIMAIVRIQKRSIEIVISMIPIIRIFNARIGVNRTSSKELKLFVTFEENKWKPGEILIELCRGFN